MELDISLRNTALNYTMSGDTRRIVDHALHQTRENRIQHLIERLCPQQNKARDDFNMNADTYILDKDKGMERD